MTIDAILASPALAGMRAERQWMIYTAFPDPKKPGKLAKLPLHPVTGAPCSVVEPANWADVETAAAAVRRFGHGFGLAFCFTEGSGRWFLDLDGCRQADGTWSPLAQQMVTQVLPGAACEISASGNGLHLFGRGVVPQHASKNIEQRAELYTGGRFCAMTGTALQGDCDTDFSAAMPWVVATYFPPKNTGALNLPDDGPVPEWRGPTDDVELLRRMLQSKSVASKFGAATSASFAELWDRDLEALHRFYPGDGEGGIDWSSVDAALAQMLCFWTGKDQARMVRLMLQSGLVRSKWEDREDYLPRTAASACGMQRDVLQDKPVVTCSQAVSDLTMADSAEWRDRWLALALEMTAADRHRFLDDVAHRTDIGKRALSATLKQAVLQAASERGRAALEDYAAGRQLIPYRDDQQTGMAAQIDILIAAAAPPGGYVSFGGVLSRIEIAELPFTHTMGNALGVPPPAVAQLKPINSVEAQRLAEGVAVLVREHPDRPPKALAMPERVVTILLQKKDHAAPRVNGLLAHPVVLSSGEIVSTPGLHAASRLFLASEPLPGLRPFNQAEAHQALRWLRFNVLEGFEFSSAAHADAALAGLMTGMQRRLLPGAPGLAILASTQSSGKTSLARNIHTVLTGRDMPITSLALGDEAETKKALVGMLERNPAMICFDNVADGATLSSAALAAVMTSPEWSERKLGGNQHADLSTAVLLVVTGNNLALGPDEVTRWLVTRLEPKTARPQERRFKHPDVHRHALALRADTLRRVLGIIAGFVQSGATVDATSTRFADWEALVARPLRWAGGADVAAGFRENIQAAPTEQALGAMVLSLAGAFADRWFSAGEVATLGLLGTSEHLREALDVLGVRNFTSKAIAPVLRSKAGRAVEIRGQNVAIHHREDSHSKRTLFQIQNCGSCG